MKYQKWTYRGGSLVVEKYVGEVNTEDIIQADTALFAEANLSNEILILVDISQATFPNINNEDLAKLYSVVDEYSNASLQIKTALYTGFIKFEDFQLVYSYAKEGADRPGSIVPFNFLDVAMRWLGLSKSEQEEISRELQKGL